MQRIGGNDAAFQRQKVQHLQSARRLVATRRFLLGQAMRASTANTLTRCSGVAFAPRS
jgi:hypothetical protein